MLPKKLQPKGFEEILDSLREHREKIDRAILAIEALRDSAIPTTVVWETVPRPLAKKPTLTRG
jgi:hypothetical protein